MSKEQDEFEKEYLISKRIDPKATFYIKSRRKKNGYRTRELNNKFQEFLKRFKG
ncbi:hypothetical protein pEaSNUABM49_00466 [Erwinia phage pEa_SNUABM_49]|nr:hypothetical protein pEaSNUABM49_00466 [Erwinia phage pEa_SNUABM_49]